MKNKFSMLLFAVQLLCSILFICIEVCNASEVDTSLHWNDKILFKINGVQDDVLKNAQARLSILEKSYSDDTQLKLNNIAIQGSKEISKAMQPYGYFNATIHFRIDKINHDNVITYFIQKGAPIKIVNIDIKIIGAGKDEAHLNALKQHLPFKLGDTFNVKHYNQAKEFLLSKANDEGYIKAYFAQSKVLIDVKSHQASIILHLQTGLQYQFGEISFTSPGYSRAFLKRFVDIKPTQHYSSQKITELQQQLSNSYYFQQAQVTPELGAISNQQVPIHINAVPPPSQRYSIGLGYGSITGPRLISGLNLRHLNDSGHHLDMQLKISPVISGVAGKYFIPGKHPLTDSWTIGANYQRSLTKNSTSTSGTISAGYLKKN